jgi:hypothetical protein
MLVDELQSLVHSHKSQHYTSWRCIVIFAVGLGEEALELSVATGRLISIVFEH